MALVEKLILGLDRSRGHFLKHLIGLRENQWDFEPFAQCLTIRKTIAHLIIDDRAATESLQTEREPDYERHRPTATDIETLLNELEESREALLTTLVEKLREAGPDQLICVWGEMLPMIVGVPYFSSEDFYHTGQVSMLRMASDPTWDYYQAIYGVSES